MSDEQVIESVQPDQGIAETPAEPTVRDAVLAAVEEVNSKDTQPKEGRDEKGKFVKKDTQAAESAAQPTKGPEGATEGTQAGSLAAPTTWKAEVRTKWDKLDPDVKAEILKREEDMSRGASQLSEKIKPIKAFYDELAPTLAPRAAALRQNFGSEAKAINQLFALSDFSQKDPVGFLRWYTQQNPNVDFGAAFQKPEASLDPEVQGLQKEIQGLKSQLQQYDQRLSGFDQFTQTQRQQATSSEIIGFAQEKDASGNPLRPHFDAVQPQIMKLVPIIRAENPDMSVREVLSKAYDDAVWLNPDTRSQVTQSQVSQAQESERKRQRAEKAVLASKSITGGTPNGGRPNGAPVNNLRAELEANFAKFAGEAARL